MLDQLAEAGLQIALALRDQATGRLAEGAEPATRGDIAMAYARVSRAVRLAIALQTRTAADQLALESATADAREAALDHEVELSPAHTRKAVIERVIQSVARSQYGGEAGVEDDVGARVNALLEEAGDRLDLESLYGEVLARPISEIVAEVCRDLGLQPDWPSLARMYWARAEMQGADPGAPLRDLTAAVSRDAPGRPPPPSG